MTSLRLFSIACVTSSLTLFSLPQEMQVVSGQAQVDQHLHEMKITTSKQTLLEWNKFSIGEHEAIQFIQPSSKSVVLNRVRGGEGSELMGLLQGNGKVYLINP